LVALVSVGCAVYFLAIRPRVQNNLELSAAAAAAGKKNCHCGETSANRRNGTFNPAMKYSS
jgi:hypothetical protein